METLKLKSTQEQGKRQKQPRANEASRKDQEWDWWDWDWDEHFRIRNARLWARQEGETGWIDGLLLFLSLLLMLTLV